MGFGPRKPRDRGEVAPALCPNCGNHVTFHLLEIRSWFSLFFIPLIPGKARHVVYCPVCQYGVQVTGDALEAARDLVDLTAEQRTGRIDAGPTTPRSTPSGRCSVANDSPTRGMRSPPPVRPPQLTSDSLDAPAPSAETATAAPPAGWYADPFGESDQRYWDGERWTAGTNPPLFNALSPIRSSARYGCRGWRAGRRTLR